MTKPEIYVEPSAYPSLGSYRVVARVGGTVGDLYLHYGTKEECNGVAAYLSRVAHANPATVRGLLRAIGRPELAEQVRDES